MTATLRGNPHVKLVVEREPLSRQRTGHRPRDLPILLRDHGVTELRVIQDSLGTECTIDEMVDIFTYSARATGNFFAPRP